MRLLALAAFLWAGAAAADLYRWVDPETGSVKYSNYPPPWYGNEARQRGAPKVERIPERQRPPAVEAEPAPLPAAPGLAPAPKPPAAPQLGALEERRKKLLPQLAAAAANPGPQMKSLFEEYAKLVAEMDQHDPKGTAARQAELQAEMEKTVKRTPK